MVKIKKFVLLFFVLLCVFLCTNSAFAAINEEYGDQTSSIDILNDTIKESKVMDYIGSFIFAIGNIAESVTSWLMGCFSGSETFPWADKIVFNTIPLLDVNFINPDDGSLFSMSSNGIGNVIRSIYFSSLSIAIGFLGIVVGVMAIRLALSSIGAEKAKYKEAIVMY